MSQFTFVKQDNINCKVTDIDLNFAPNKPPPPVDKIKASSGILQGKEISLEKMYRYGYRYRTYTLSTYRYLLKGTVA